MITEQPNTIQNLKTLQIIVVALGTGALLHALVIIFLSLNSEASSQPNPALPILRIAHFIVSAVLMVMSKFVATKIISDNNNAKDMNGKPMSFLKRYFTSIIVQVAMLEGAALFGGVIFLIASGSGAVRNDQTYYFHFLPHLYLLFQIKKLFPTEYKYSEIERMYNSEA